MLRQRSEVNTHLLREDTFIDFPPEVHGIFSMQGADVHLSHRRGAWESPSNKSQQWKHQNVNWRRRSVSPIWLNESDPAGTTRGLAGSKETLFLIGQEPSLTSGYTGWDNINICSVRNINFVTSVMIGGFYLYWITAQHLFLCCFLHSHTVAL